MESTTPKINCTECTAGNHNRCFNEKTCLCAEDKHGIREPTLQEIGSSIEELRKNAPIDPREPQEYEHAVEDAARCWDIECDDRMSGVPLSTLRELITLFITTKHIVSKHEMNKELLSWAISHDFTAKILIEEIDSVFDDIDITPYAKAISAVHGANDRHVIFDIDQLQEAGEWIKGRYHIKRIDLTGDRLFFNGKRYQTETTAIVQRAVRDIMPTSKSREVAEITKYIEQTCPIIAWKDIEDSIHLKSLSNGTYDIKSGSFTPGWDHKHIILNEIPHDYVEDGNWSTIDATVTGIIADSDNRQSFYDFLSTCMQPYSGVDFQFTIVGGAGTGKSQIGVLAEMVLGEDNCGDATIHSVAADPTTQKSTAFKMLNIDNDMGDSTVKHIEVLKKWITQDKFTARGIYEQPTTFKPMSRLLEMTNDLFEIPNESDAEAIYDRTYAMEANRKYRHQDDEVKNIMKKRATPEELSSFTSYLLRNATWISENERYHHPLRVSEVEKIWNAFGNRVKMFFKKYTVPSADVRVPSGEPYNAFMNYAIANNFKAKDKKRFTAIFDEVAGNSATKTSVTVDGQKDYIYAYSGFRMKTEEELKADAQGLLDSV